MLQFIFKNTNFALAILLVISFTQIADAQIFRRAYTKPVTHQQTVSYEKAEIIPHVEEAWHKLNDEEKQFIAELDRLRKQLNLPQIIVVEQIVDDSRRWSSYLHKTKRFYHGSSQENIAVGHEDGARTFRQWVASPPHYAKLCNKADAHCGIGQSGKYWTYRAVPRMENYTGTTSFMGD